MRWSRWSEAEQASLFLFGCSLPLTLVQPHRPTIFLPKTVSVPADCTGVPPCRTDVPSCTRNVGLVGGGWGGPSGVEASMGKSLPLPLSAAKTEPQPNRHVATRYSPQQVVEFADQQSKL